MTLHNPSQSPTQARQAPNLGMLGYLAIFAASLAAVMAAPPRVLPWSAALCLLAAALVYPSAFRRLMRLRWLVMITLLALPAVFVVGEVDRSLAGIPLSSEGLQTGFQIVVRIVVVLIAIDGLTSSVDIASVAGLLEKAGLRGLGFSVGVALNLLPSLQQSALNSWRSLWMRGGLRKRRWRSLTYLAVAIVSNALSRAEEIALAAEARAFSPQRARRLPVVIGRFDPLVVTLSLAAILVAFLVV